MFCSGKNSAERGLSRHYAWCCRGSSPVAATHSVAAILSPLCLVLSGIEPCRCYTLCRRCPIERRFRWNARVPRWVMFTRERCHRLLWSGIEPCRYCSRRGLCAPWVMFARDHCYRLSLSDFEPFCCRGGTVCRRRPSTRALLVWIVMTATVTKVVEGCVFFRGRFKVIFSILSGGEFEHSVLSALRSPVCLLKQRRQINSSDRVAARASGRRLYEHTSD